MKWFAVCFFAFFCSSIEAACVREWKANLRKGPGAQYQKSWVVGKYMPLREMGREGRWIRVRDVDNKEHWVYAPLLTRSVACVVVKVPYTFVRTGPGTKYPKAEIEVADKYTPYKKVGEKPGWVQVEDLQEKRFWIASNNLWEPVRVQKINF